MDINAQKDVTVVYRQFTSGSPTNPAARAHQLVEQFVVDFSYARTDGTAQMAKFLENIQLPPADDEKGASKRAAFDAHKDDAPELLRPAEAWWIWLNKVYMRVHLS